MIVLHSKGVWEWDILLACFLMLLAGGPWTSSKTQPRSSYSGHTCMKVGLLDGNGCAQESVRLGKAYSPNFLMVSDLSCRSTPSNLSTTRTSVLIGHLLFMSSWMCLTPKHLRVLSPTVSMFTSFLFQEWKSGLLTTWSHRSVWWLGSAPPSYEAQGVGWHWGLFPWLVFWTIVAYMAHHTSLKTSGPGFPLSGVWSFTVLYKMIGIVMTRYETTWKLPHFILCCLYCCDCHTLLYHLVFHNCSRAG